ncbi:MAG TPA: class I SAM-dependent methyltransferase [Chitinophagaceae bacterium]|jgi:2-polyprenyl-3-methyl-5-hydroxy-6-metoxy-1,4-benzoquinol methylase|nr:class I SAM-dependent methyltransferase [Chitinophagaceae bacterium]
MNNNLISYYNDRAKEYEKVYANPDEQEDLLAATTLFQTTFSNKTILEIACGTGYWTEQIAKTATSVFATDINKSVADIAKARAIPGNVTIEVADMYDLNIDKRFEGLFGGFIWSHILLQDLDGFLQQLKKLLHPNASIVFIDSNMIEGAYHDLSRITKTDEYGNTYQTRSLEDGTSHLVLKNFPAKEFLVEKLSAIATNIQYIKLKYYWIVTCNLNDTY